MEHEPLDAGKLIGKMSRRDLLKSMGLAGLLGGGAWFGSKKGLGYLTDKLTDNILAATEREIRELVLNLEALVGVVQRKFEAEMVQLKQHYTDGKLNILANYGIADPNEISE